MRTRIPVLSIVLLAVLTALSGCGGADSRRLSHLDRGKNYYEHGDYGRASVEFRNAMQIAPKDPESQLWAGRTAEKLGRLRDAAALFQSVLELSPDNEPAQVDLGRLYDFVGAPKLALKVADTGLAKHPNDVDLLVVRGSARSQLQDAKGGRADAERAVRLQPQNENAVALLAGIDRDDGQIARAASLLRTTLQTLPHSRDLREVLLDLDVRLNDVAEAERELTGLISDAPTDLRYRAQLAQLYLQSKSLDDAQKTLENAVKALPHSDEAKLLLADFVSTNRTRQAGEQLLRSFIDQAPDDYRLRLGLGSLLERARAMDEAVAVYDEIVKRDGDGPDAITARNRIARIELIQGRLDDAQKQVAAVLRVNSQDDEALAIRGSLALERNDPQAAITDLRVVVRDEPGSTRGHRLLAQAYGMHHEPQLAEDELRSAVESAPNDAGLRVDLANFYANSKRPDDGIKILEGAVRQLPDNVALREALVRAYMAKGDLTGARRAAEDFEKALPQAPEGSYLAGIVAQADKRWADSEQDYEQSLAIVPTFAPAAALTRLELARGEGTKALADLKRLSDRNPRSALALEMLGEVYIANKDYARATDALSRAIAADPTWWYPYRNLAVCKTAQGDVAGAVAAYQAGLRAAPESPQLALELTSYYIRNKRYDDAIALYDGLLHRDPHSQLAASNLALLLATYRTDRDSLDRARDLTSTFDSANDGALLDVRGWVSLKLGEVQQALPVLEHAAARTPDSKLVRFHLAIAELEAGKRDQARADLQTALAGSASFPGADEARAALASLRGKAG